MRHSPPLPPLSDWLDFKNSDCLLISCLKTHNPGAALLLRLFCRVCFSERSRTFRNPVPYLDISPRFGRVIPGSVPATRLVSLPRFYDTTCTWIQKVCRLHTRVKHTSLAPLALVSPRPIKTFPYTLKLTSLRDRSHFLTRSTNLHLNCFPVVCVCVIFFYNSQQYFSHLMPSVPRETRAVKVIPALITFLHRSWRKRRFRSTRQNRALRIKLVINWTSAACVIYLLKIKTGLIIIGYVN